MHFRAASTDRVFWEHRCPQRRQSIFGGLQIPVVISSGDENSKLRSCVRLTWNARALKESYCEFRSSSFGFSLSSTSPRARCGPALTRFLLHTLFQNSLDARIRPDPNSSVLLDYSRRHRYPRVGAYPGSGRGGRTEKSFSLTAMLDCRQSTTTSCVIETIFFLLSLSI